MERHQLRFAILFSAYFHSAATLNYVRTLVDSGFAGKGDKRPVGR